MLLFLDLDNDISCQTNAGWEVDGEARANWNKTENIN